MKKTIILAGTGRSGTTWIQRVLNGTGVYRSVFEPLHTDYVPEFKAYRSRQYLRPGDKRAEYVEPMNRLLAGSIRNMWVDKLGGDPSSNVQIIKFVRANLMLEWMRRLDPSLQIAFLLRHPFAVAMSRINYEWPIALGTYTNQPELVEDYLAPHLQMLESLETDFEKHVAAWCIETLVPLGQLATGGYIPVWYETLRNDPEKEMARLCEQLGFPFGEAELALINQPSSVSTADSRKALSKGENLATRWKDQVDDSMREKSKRVVETFGLESLYDLDSGDPIPDALADVVRNLKSNRSHRSRASTQSNSNNGTSQSRQSQRVLCFAPYNKWQLHGVWEMTILHGLRLRGAEVKHVFCDGVFTDCDIHWKATNPRTPDACMKCQASVTKLAAELRAPYEWMSRYLRPEERGEALLWAGNIPNDGLRSATYNDWPIGEWVLSSVHQHFRNSVLDLDDEEIARTYRSYLFSGLLSAFAAKRMLDEFKPDVLFLFNGKFSMIRPIKELATERGIRLVTHERGRILNSMWIVKGIADALTYYHDNWMRWKDIPLSQVELDEVREFIHKKRHGVDQPWHSFSPPPSDGVELRQKLGLRDGHPLWAMFPSSDDESASNKERDTAYNHQDEWIEETIDYATLHPEIDLVVRAHPNIKDSNRGLNRRQYKYFKDLKESVPGNIRVIMPEEEISSYTLADIATLGLVYRSSMSLEMANQGQHVITAGGGWFSGTHFMQSVEDRRDYQSMLDENLKLPLNERNPEIMRAALRFNYTIFLRMNTPFPLVRMNGYARGEPVYNSITDLAPGKDEQLDKICRVILEDEEIFPIPLDAHIRRSADAENEMIERAVTDWQEAGYVVGGWASKPLPV